MTVAPDVRVCAPGELATVAAALIAVELDATIHKRGVARIAVAGGRTPRATYRVLAPPPYRDNLTWSAVHIYFGDERCVAADDTQSNYRMVDAVLLSHVAVPPTNVHWIRGELAPEMAALDYVAQLGDAPLDVVLLGMGNDGHTASLFSETPLASTAPVLATRSPVPPTDRVSLGLGPINSAGVVVLLVAGEAKAERLAQVHGQITAGRPVWPAAHVQPTNGRLIWIIDAEAARRLSPDAGSRTCHNPPGGQEHHGG